MISQIGTRHGGEKKNRKTKNMNATKMYLSLSLAIFILFTKTTRSIGGIFYLINHGIFYFFTNKPILLNHMPQILI